MVLEKSCSCIEGWQGDGEGLWAIDKQSKVQQKLLNITSTHTAVDLLARA